MAVTLGLLNLTSLDLSQAGSIGVANGIKSAVLGASAWYFPYVIYNGTTIALWLNTFSLGPHATHRLYALGQVQWVKNGCQQSLSANRSNQ